MSSHVSPCSIQSSPQSKLPTFECGHMCAVCLQAQALKREEAQKRQEARSPLMCPEHPKQLALVFCRWHNRLVCQSCLCYAAKCSFISLEFEDLIAECIMSKIKGSDRPLPARFLREYDRRSEMTFRELVTFYPAWISAQRSLFCTGCEGDAYRWIDTRELLVYCDQCYERTKAENPENVLVSCGEDQAQLTAHLYKIVVYPLLQRINFFDLEQCLKLWATDYPRNLPEFVKGAKEILLLSRQSNSRPQDMPCFYECVRCSGFMRKYINFVCLLPCIGAVHGVCEKCAEQFETQGEAVCPMDGKTFTLEQFRTAGKVVARRCTNCREDGEERNPTTPGRPAGWLCTSCILTKERTGELHPPTFEDFVARFRPK